MKTVKKGDAQVFHLPGRDWYYLVGPLNSQARNLVFGIALFPPGSKPGAHVHANEEEIIYITAGQGKIVFQGHREMVLEPGVAIFIPPGVEHCIIAQGDEALEMVTVFSPPVFPGAYDRR